MSNKKTWFFCGLSILIQIIAYYVWFLPNLILTSGDWMFSYSETTRDLLSNALLLWSPNGFGAVNVSLPMMPKYFLNGLLGTAGISDILNRQLTYLWPTVILSSLGMFLLGKTLIKSNLAGFLASVTFGLSVAMIGNRTGHLTTTSATAFAPFVFLLILKTFETKKISFALLTALSGFTMGFNEFRIFLPTAGIIFIYALYYSFIVESFTSQRFIKNMKLFFFIALVLGLLNTYWLSALFSSSFHNTADLGVTRPGLHVAGHNNIMIALTSWNTYWTGGRQSGGGEPIPFYFWMIPIISLLGFLVNRRNRQLAFFALVSLGSILLTKQVGIPFPALYQLLFDLVPGFNIYREPSKFIYITVIAQSLLIAAFISWLTTEWRNGKYTVHIRRSVPTLILLMFLVNAKPLLTGEIDTLFIPRQIPDDYLIVKDFILNQPKYFRVLWIPAQPRWSIYTNNHPAISYIDIKGSTWGELYDPERYKYLSKVDSMFAPLKQPFSDNLLDSASIKYVMVPLQDIKNEDDFYIHWGLSKQSYVDELDKIPYLKRFNIDTDEVVVYENENTLPHFYTPQYLIYSDSKKSNWNYISSLTDYPKGNAFYFDKETVKSLGSWETFNEIFTRGNPITPLTLSSNWNEHWAWPEVNVNPSNILKYRLVYMKEWLIEKTKRGYSEKIDVLLWHATKRVAEIRKFGVKDSRKLEENYENKLSKILLILENVPKKDRDEDYTSMVSKVLTYTKKAADYNSPPAQRAHNNIQSFVESWRNANFNKYRYELELPKKGEYEIFVNKESLGKTEIENLDGYKITIGDKDLKPTQHQKEADFVSFGTIYLDQNTSFNLEIPDTPNLIADEQWQLHEDPKPLIKDLEVFHGKSFDFGKIWYKKIRDWQPINKYRLTFKYTSQRKSLAVAIIEDIEETEKDTGEVVLVKKNSFYKSLPLEIESDQKVKEKVRPLLGSKNGYLIIYGDEKLEPPSDIEIKELTIQEILEPQLILKQVNKELQINNKNTPNIKDIRINPTKYKIKINEATDPYTLVFNERYDDGWKLYKDNRKIAEENHFPVNGYANSWYIKPEEVNNERDYELIVEFAPQRLVYVGMAISGITLLGCLVYLILSFFRKQRNE